MSDGGTDATLDHRRSPGAGNGHESAPQPTLGAAPWERFSQPPADHGVHRWQPEPPLAEPTGPAEPVEAPADEAEPSGCHTDGGLTVADLIAKVGAPTNRPSRRRAAPDPEPGPAKIATDVPVDLQDTQVIDTPAYLLDVTSELHLDAANYPAD